MMSVTAIANSAVYKAVQCNDKIVEKEECFEAVLNKESFVVARARASLEPCRKGKASCLAVQGSFVWPTLSLSLV